MPISLKATALETAHPTLRSRADLMAATPAVAGLILLAAPTSTAVTLAAIAFLAIGFALRPSLGLGALAVLLPFYLAPRALSSMVFSMPELALLSAVTGAALRGIWAWRGSARPLIAHLATPLDGPAALFLAAALTSLLASEILRVSLRELRILVLEPLAAYYLAVWFLRRERDMVLVVAGLLLGGSAAALMGLYQYFFTDHVVAVEGVRRMLGPYLSPNHMGLYLGRMLPMAMALALFLPARRALSVPLAAILAVALFLTFSIGAWLASGLAIATVTGLWWGRPTDIIHKRRTPRLDSPSDNLPRRHEDTKVDLYGIFASSCLRGYRIDSKPVATALSIVAVLAVLALVIPLLGAERIWSHFVAGGTGFIRLQLWEASINMVRDHPLLGVGMDNFLYHYRTSYMLPEAAAEPNLSHPHNLLLNFWLEMGILGVAAAAWLLVALWRLGYRAWQQSQSALGRAMLAGIAGASVDLVAHGLVDNSYFLVDLAFHFWLVAGIIVAVQGPYTHPCK